MNKNIIINIENYYSNMTVEQEEPKKQKKQRRADVKGPVIYPAGHKAGKPNYELWLDGKRVKQSTSKDRLEVEANRLLNDLDWERLTWDERGHLLKDGKDTNIEVSDLNDIASMMVGGGSGRGLAAYFYNAEFETLMFLGANYNTQEYNEMIKQGYAIMNKKRGF